MVAVSCVLKRLKRAEMAGMLRLKPQVKGSKLAMLCVAPLLAATQQAAPAWTVAGGSRQSGACSAF